MKLKKTDKMGFEEALMDLVAEGLKNGYNYDDIGTALEAQLVAVQEAEEEAELDDDN
jgi:hypothetical protein